MLLAHQRCVTARRRVGFPPLQIPGGLLTARRHSCLGSQLAVRTRLPSLRSRMSAESGAKFWKALFTQGAKEAFQQDRMEGPPMSQAASSAGSSGVTSSAGTSEVGAAVVQILIVDDESGCGGQSQTLKEPVRKAQRSAKQKNPPAKKQRKTSKETGKGFKTTGDGGEGIGLEGNGFGRDGLQGDGSGLEGDGLEGNGLEGNGLEGNGLEGNGLGGNGLGGDGRGPDGDRRGLEGDGRGETDSKEPGADSKETGLGDQQEAGKVECYHCGDSVSQVLCRMRCKTPPKWQCNRCNCKLVHLNRLCKTWPPKEFANLSIQEQQEFFRQTAGLSGEDTKAALVNALSRNLISRKKEADTGRFLPLAWYKKEGFDTKMIQETATDQDRMWSPRFGWAYKVDIREHSWEQVEETVRQELIQTLFRRGTADRPRARSSHPKSESDSDEGSSDAEGEKAQALKAFLKERKAKEKEQKAEEEKRLKEAVAETKVLAGKMVRKVTPVLDKLKTQKQNPLFSDVPSIVTKKAEQAQTELEHFLRHAQSRKETPAKGLKLSIEEVEEGVARANATIASLKRFYATLAKA